jgi:large subunit ribosomal protein L23
MRDHFDVILGPVITERATQLQEEQNVYTFIVHPDANKHQIADAVEKGWDVVVEKVRTAQYRGKARRAFIGRMNQRSPIGRRPSYKKALVRLAEGDKIEFYEAG